MQNLYENIGGFFFWNLSKLFEQFERVFMQILLVLLGVGEEALVKSVGQLNNHSTISYSNQSICRFRGKPVSALKLVTLHHPCSFSFVDINKF